MSAGSLLYDKVLALIDYCGDIRGKRDSYSQKFSPNNIRRLYLSADGAVVTYHVNAGVGLSKLVAFQPEMVANCVMQPDYVPMLYVLSADRVCASVEEVVICTGSNNGMTLDQRELAFDGLIKSYKGGGKDIKDVIMNRYKRLHAFIISPSTLNDFIHATEQAKSPIVTLSSLDIARRCNIEYFHEDDWYKNYGTSAQFYALDMAGSPLNKHFLRVKAEFENRAKTEDFDKFKAEKVKGLDGDFLKAYEQCLQVIRCYTKLVKLQQKNGGSVFGVSLPQHRFLVLNKCDSLKGKQPSLVKITEEKSSEKEALKDNIEKCNIYAKSVYFDLIGALLYGLEAMNAKYPTTTEVLMRGIDKAISVPPQLEPINQKLPYPLSGKRFANSVANICVLLGILCIGEFKFVDKEVWVKCMNS